MHQTPSSPSACICNLINDEGKKKKLIKIPRRSFVYIIVVALAPGWVGGGGGATLINRAGVYPGLSAVSAHSRPGSEFHLSSCDKVVCPRERLLHVRASARLAASALFCPIPQPSAPAAPFSGARAVNFVVLGRTPAGKHSASADADSLFAVRAGLWLLCRFSGRFSFSPPPGPLFFFLPPLLRARVCLESQNLHDSGPARFFFCF